VELVGAVGAFDQLFERAEFGADIVEIFESDDGLSVDDGLSDCLIVASDWSWALTCELA